MSFIIIETHMCTIEVDGYTIKHSIYINQTLQ